MEIHNVDFPVEEAHGTGDHPIVYSPKHNKVFVGPRDSFHFQVRTHPSVAPYIGRFSDQKEGRWNKDSNTVAWFGPSQTEVTKALGAKAVDEDDWGAFTFGKTAGPRFADPAEQLMATKPHWEPYNPNVKNNQHRKWRWTAPDGTVHTAGCGSGSHSTDDAMIDAKMLKGRIRRCEGGACDHIPAGIIHEQHLTAEPQAPLFRVGQEVILHGKPTWITEIDGTLVGTLNAQGEVDTAETHELKAASGPLTVYHGTDSEFEGLPALHPGTLGIWTTPDKNEAATYYRDYQSEHRRVIPMHLHAENTLQHGTTEYWRLHDQHVPEGETARKVQGQPAHDFRQAMLGAGYDTLWIPERSMVVLDPRKLKPHPEEQPGRHANILDPIHDTLDERVWEDAGEAEPRLKAHHAQWIERHILNALRTNGYEDAKEWLSLVFTGSLTTYQYSDESDVDISLFIDSEVFPEWSRAELIGLMVAHCDGAKLPGTPFPMQCFVVPSTISKEDLYQPGLRSGWDFNERAWIVPPERSRSYDVQAQQNGDWAYALEQADKMERLLKFEPDKAELFWHQIHERRRASQKAGKGDHSPANIVYKFLANRGLFPVISELTGEYIAKQGAQEWRWRSPSFLQQMHQLVEPDKLQAFYDKLHPDQAEALRAGKLPKRIYDSPTKEFTELHGVCPKCGSNKINAFGYQGEDKHCLECDNSWSTHKPYEPPKPMDQLPPLHGPNGPMTVNNFGKEGQSPVRAWQPGYHGKAVLHEGVPYVWAIQGDGEGGEKGWPHHEEVFQQLTGDPRSYPDHETHAPAYIDPEGNLEPGGFWPDTLERDIQRYEGHPHIKVNREDMNEDFHFGSDEPTPEQKIEVKLYENGGGGKHPPTEHGRSFPWIYTPETNELHLGAVDNYHHAVIGQSDYLRSIYGQADGNAPVTKAPSGHVHGRMSIPPAKVMMFSGQHPMETMQKLADRVGGSIAPANLEEPEEFNFG